MGINWFITSSPPSRNKSQETPRVLLARDGHVWSITRNSWSTIHNKIRNSRPLFHWFFQHSKAKPLVDYLNKPTIISLYVCLLIWINSNKQATIKLGVIWWQSTTPFCSLHNSLYESLRPSNTLLKTRCLHCFLPLFYN